MGRPASGTTSRTSIIGRKDRRCCSKRGAKSIVMTDPPLASRSTVSTTAVFVR